MISPYTPSRSRAARPSPAAFASQKSPAAGLLPSQLIMPIGNRCLKIEHRDDLNPESLASLGRAVAFARDRYPHFNWALVVTDRLHDNLADITHTIKTLVPADYRGRIAVVWVGRLKCCAHYAVQEVPLACECQLFCSAHYGKALEWLNVTGAP